MIVQHALPHTLTADEVRLRCGLLPWTAFLGEREVKSYQRAAAAARAHRRGPRRHHRACVFRGLSGHRRAAVLEHLATGTGRTTRMLCDALALASAGRRVGIHVHHERFAEQLRRRLVLMAEPCGVPLQHLTVTANDEHLRGRGLDHVLVDHFVHSMDSYRRRTLTVAGGTFSFDARRRVCLGNFPFAAA